MKWKTEKQHLLWQLLISIHFDHLILVTFKEHPKLAT